MYRQKKVFSESKKLVPKVKLQVEMYISLQFCFSFFYFGPIQLEDLHKVSLLISERAANVSVTQ